MGECVRKPSNEGVINPIRQHTPLIVNYFRAKKPFFSGFNDAITFRDRDKLTADKKKSPIKTKMDD